MQLAHSIITLSGLTFVAAVPAALEPRDPENTLLVTFWKDGCDLTEPGVPSSATISINSDDGPHYPGACELNPNTGWKALQVKQPSNADIMYSIEFFAGEGCQNPINASIARLVVGSLSKLTIVGIKVVSDAGTRCYSAGAPGGQPQGPDLSQVKTFKATLL